MPDVLGVLHLADLYKNPAMRIPSIRDWQKIQAYLKGAWPLPAPAYVTTTDPGVVETWVRRAYVEKPDYIVIDTEYDPKSKFLHLVGIGYNGSQVLQFENRVADWVQRRKFGELLNGLVRTFTVVLQNTFADVPILEHAYGIPYCDYKHIDDTMLSHAVLWSDWPHDLEFLASIYGKHNKMKHLSTVNPGLYNAGDVVDTISAWEVIRGELNGDKRSKEIYETQSLRLIPVILKARKVGLRVNKERVAAATATYNSRLSWAQSFACAYAGWPINVGSDDQLKRVLYDVEGLPLQVLKEDKTKSTINADAIATLRQIVGPPYDPEQEEKEGLSIEEAVKRVEEGAHPLLEARVIYAGALQILSHYLNPCEGNDRLFPEFKIHAQASGRWSTTDPPMAQLPSDLRDIVMPDEGERWIEWDWDQIELRILAELANDEPYREAFANQYDIHTLNACAIFGLPTPPNRVDPHKASDNEGWRRGVNWGGKDDIRRLFAKRFVYRLNYGGEPRTAGDIPGAKQLNLGPKELVAASNGYLRAHPAIRSYWGTLVAEGLKTRESRTFLGRRRRLLVDGKNSMKRLLYNHPMQGAVSDIFNLTVLSVSAACPYATFKYGMHDSQKWGVPSVRYEEAKGKMVEITHTPWRIGGRDVVLPATFKD